MNNLKSLQTARLGFKSVIGIPKNSEMSFKLARLFDIGYYLSALRTWISIKSFHSNLGVIQMTVLLTLVSGGFYAHSRIMSDDLISNSFKLPATTLWCSILIFAFLCSFLFRWTKSYYVSPNTAIFNSNQAFVKCITRGIFIEDYWKRRNCIYVDRMNKGSDRIALVRAVSGLPGSASEAKIIEKIKKEFRVQIEEILEGKPVSKEILDKANIICGEIQVDELIARMSQREKNDIVRKD